ncbi:alpha-1,6-mannosylglycoprotein 6-beta-N-acetylglucosaminyltransferase A-like [Gigantopelta aegis]|uniref:alpha-1,6-mannosylglycoprotein 6-beta-N-acetylglucosaminyltransferase A-like n=1 Tax=Gigantopelta aegis TaxID=1735272 RepID=UPI001B88DB13|nr:alpha-1,6-mannosylglycoprotein 6-beta-N-acetylglucosaminyltransferase A-like [Gigantopelta aegis]XP_041374586.1 alpha-1,6-mannosylglycoprotein 6-beta-N-acetylglucosaminyltransferase A-like [Gigantopelta aegis]
MACSPWHIMTRGSVYRKIFVLAMLFGVLWCLMLVKFSMTLNVQQHKSSEVLKEEIVRLSEDYIRSLARENGDMVDGPYAGRFTAYDLKKTMAVLLENILERVQRLERAVDILLNSTTLIGIPSLAAVDNSKLRPIIRAKDLIEGVEEKCQLSEEDKNRYPHCLNKMAWMKAMWKSDPCYVSYGVDGSDCSFVMYLSEVEGFCPKKAWGGSHKLELKEGPVLIAKVRTDLDGLLTLLKDPNERQGYAWIRMRISRMWSKWTAAIGRLQKKQDLTNRKTKKILIHLGLLSKQSGWKFAEMQFKGGPLGELVQWADLISTLYIFGHELTITSEVEQLVEILAKLPAKSPCQSRKELPVNMIYTDIMGLIQFKKKVRGGFGKFSCLFRVVDSFGTEPAYNHRGFAKQNKILSSWGGQDLQPKQFFTMFPHSPDNSFMGFVVEQLVNLTENIKRKDQALVYGKNVYMWEGKQAYLDTIHKYVEVHGTVYSSDEKPRLPSYVNNHGLLIGKDLHRLLRQSKIFVGLGFPYEGPAPLEAIANGAVFINPKFSPPHSSKNTAFFKGKPTHRELTSQHPYAEMFIGPPYVHTVHINNTQQVGQLVEEILKNNTFSPYLPFEYTEEGMLQRMNAYIQHQDFCRFENAISIWPPSEAIKTFLGPAGISCRDVCWNHNLICEPTHFKELNSFQQIEKQSVTCAKRQTQTNIFFPSYNENTKECTLQGDELLFSCVGEKTYLRRLCPCRNYIVGQIALCQGCER